MPFKYIQCDWCGHTKLLGSYADEHKRRVRMTGRGICRKCLIAGGTKPTRIPQPDDIEFDEFMKRMEREAGI